MVRAIVRFFQPPEVRLFRLSPLYAEPGWYGVADGTGTVGPYPRTEDALEALKALSAQHPEDMHEH